MKNILLLSFLLIALAIAKEIPKQEVLTESEPDVTTVVTESDSSITEVESSSVKEESTSISPISTTIASSLVEIPDENHETSEHFQAPPKRKVLYINQQQSGKFNVHLELNDVSLIVIPNKKDPQLSLLNLLLRSAQKSNNLKKNEQSEHEKKNVQVDESAKAASMETSSNNHNDEYSKYKSDNYLHPSSTNDPYPSIPAIESRVAPYKVDISSTLSQPSPVEIIPNANLMARSPVVKLLKPIPVAVQHQRIFKRSIENYGIDFAFDSPVLHDTSISSYDNEENELTESITNSLENDDKLNAITGNGDGSEFILLGAVENCGPGRKRNSYQVCVPEHE